MSRLHLMNRSLRSSRMIQGRIGLPADVAIVDLED
jgi:hypothetical protein